MFGWVRARRHALRMGGMVTIASMAVVLGGPITPASATSYRYPDAYYSRTLCELKVFTDWLSTNHVKGYIGEAGWPGTGEAGRKDVAQWDALAEKWYRAADAADLWVTAQETTQLHSNADFPRLMQYYPKVFGQPVDTRSSQTKVAEAHPTTQSYLRGVNFPDGRAGFGTLQNPDNGSNSKRGTFGVTYDYGSQQSYAFLAANGVKLVRLPIRWERVQPKLGAPLDAVEVNRIKAAFAAMKANNMVGVLDVHNYAVYYQTINNQNTPTRIGLGNVPESTFLDLWGRLADAFKDNPTVIGYDLMNEPNGVDDAPWHKFSQDAVSTIRAHGDGKLIFVEGADFASAQWWLKHNPQPWITDPMDNFRYEAHDYWDDDHTSHFDNTYPQEVAIAQQKHWHASGDC